MRGVIGHGARLSLRWCALACVCSTLAACKPDKTLEVSSFTDGGAGSLRAAIDVANRTSAEGANSVIIELPAGNYDLRVCAADETNFGGDLDLLTNLPITLVADGGNVVIRQTCAGERVLDAHGNGRLTLRGITLTGGSVVSDDDTLPAEGGGLRARHDVRLEGVTVTGNRVAGAAAQPSSYPVLATPGGAARGGGVFAGGALALVDSVVSENQAIGGSGPSLAEGSEVPQAGAASGGGVFAAGALDIVRTTFRGNTSRGGTGAVGRGGEARGGAVATARGLTSSGSTFTSNQALSGDSPYAPAGIPGQPPSCTGEPAVGAAGGALWAAENVTSQTDRYDENVSAQGAGCDGYITRIYIPPLPGWPGGYIDYLVADVPPLSSGGGLASGASISAVGSQFRANHIEKGYGSALSAALDATLDGASVRDNRENAGGLGHAVDAPGSATLTNSVLDGNTNGVRAGSVQARAVTIANTSRVAVESAGSVSLVNATLFGRGSAVKAGHLSLTHCTITRSFEEAADVPLLEADQLDSHATLAVGSPLCQVTSVGATAYNWFSSACGLAGTGDRQGEPLFVLGLEPLADNGGPVPTRALAPASVLRDAVPTSACTVTSDARGTSRPQNGACDVGAYEATAISGVGPADLAVAFTNPPAFVVPGTRGTWTIRLRNNGPRAALPIVWLRSVSTGLPEVIPVSVSAPGATCTTTSEVVCMYESPLASGASTSITFVGGVQTGVQAAFTLQAQVFAASLRAPFSDDTASVVTRTTAQAGLSLRLQNNRYYGIGFDMVPSPIASVFNSSLSEAVASPARPIRIEFQPAPGVSALPVDFSTELFAIQTTPVPGNGQGASLSFYFPISELHTPLLGTLRLDPGLNPLAGPASMSLYNADLTLQAERAAGVQAPGAPLTFSVRALNQGPGRAENVTVALGWGGSSAVAFTWSTAVGSIVPGAPGTFLWQIPALTSGQTAVLSGSVPYIPAAEDPLDMRYLGLQASSSAIEFVPGNNGTALNLTAAPAGTMDLYVSDIRIVPGASPAAYVLRATVRNAGPAAALGTWEDPIRVAYEPQRHGAFSSGLTALESGWTCDLVSCTRSEPLAAGATATFEWTLDERFSSVDPLLGVVVSARAGAADARPFNDSRFIPVP